jgi:RHS repeat-associated protein
LFATKTKNQQWLDLEGDGHLDVVSLDGDSPGFYKRNWNAGGAWDTFKPFSFHPNVDWGNSNLRFIDLTGDGKADVLITDDEIFTWYPAWAEKGFGPAQFWRPPLDEDNGPRILLSDGVETIYLADMTGDGLSDLTRIRNGEICYWPNIGYGRFGSKVTMAHSPWFDFPDIFHQSRLRLADIDGSGTTDVLYLCRHEVKFYLNQAGNGWTDGQSVWSVPKIDDSNNVQVLDLLGHGTACLVWSSFLPFDGGRQLRYIDLMVTGKPYLLTKMVNNVGSETHISYESSSHFYLQDKAAGKQWMTRLPFPVQVVAQQSIYDLVSRNRFTTRFAYHEGYYDGFEREFRGFGMIETWDTEDFSNLSSLDSSNHDLTSNSPPVWTKTWYHTGTQPVDGLRLENHLEKQYFREPGLEHRGTEWLPHSQIPNAIRIGNSYSPYSLSPGDVREAFRSLKGSMLRSETYSMDGSGSQNQPYSVHENNYTLELLQPRSSNQHAIFLTHSRESVSLSYERKLYRIGSQMLADPRVSHNLVLAVDEWANVLQSASIGYGRRHPDVDGIADHETDTMQKKSYATYSLNQFTNSIDNEHAYLTPALAESRAYEILKLVPCEEVLALKATLMSFEHVRSAICNLASGKYDLPFEDYLGLQAIRDHPYRRLLEHKRSVFRKNDFSGPLPLGKLESLAIPYQTFQLALSKEQVEQMYVGVGKLSQSSIEVVMTQEGGYVHSQGDCDWWISSSRLYYSANRHDPPVAELEHARKHFFTIRRARDPFDTESVPIESYVTFDKYDLQVQESEDSLGSRVTAGERNIDPTKPLVQNGLDYRLLQPFLVMDPNRNRSMVAFDVLGFVVGSARMGKPEEEVGDSLKSFKAILPEEKIREHFEDPLAGLDALLGTASTRFIYDYYAYFHTKRLSQPQPVVCSLLERETHVSDLSSGEVSRIFVSFSYSDGFGRLIQNKKQADPGPLLHGPSPEVVVENRWIGSGWTVYNNKGSTIRKYEPFFTSTHKFQNDNRIGVSPILLYDPLQRIVATILPNKSWTKTVIDPWRKENWDSSDTVLIEDPKTDPCVGEYFSHLPDEDFLPTWYQQRIDGSKGNEEKTAAEKTVFHANTPGFEFFDTLGRTFLSIAMNRTSLAKGAVEEYLPNRAVLDIQGNQHELFDPRLRLVEVVQYNFLGMPLSQSNIENAQRWMLNDIKGKPIYTWDSREQQFRTEYDQLRRPLRIFLRPSGKNEMLVERSDYGEFESDPELHNVRGRTVRIYDQSGISIMDNYDFQGNLLNDFRKIAREYKSTLDWSEEVPLEEVEYTDSMKYDALNRPVQVIQPDGSISKYFYNVCGLLKNTSTNLQGSDTSTAFVADTQYDAKGQRLSLCYGNDVRTTYSYDPFTFRLTSITTKRLSSEFKNTSKSTVQNLHYTYDPTGNITMINDKSQQSVFFKNHKVNPNQEYTYDALYRLVEARGREHVGQLEHRGNVRKPDYGTQFFHPHDGEAMARYSEEYCYDKTGNILSIRHRNHSLSSGWTKHYFYNEPSLLEPQKFSNRLSSTKIGTVEDFYRYEGLEGIHGNITSMSRIPIMEWDYKDRLKATANYKASGDDGCVPQTTWYTYDGTGMRVRKVTENHCKAGERSVPLKETIYIGGAYQIFRRYSGSEEMTFELETLSLMENDRLVALVETKTEGITHHKVPGQLIRYQLSNHQDSISLELGDTGQLISFEEYTPYGDTSYKATYGEIEIPKLYRYTGRERDDSGLYYNAARFYAPWIGRWINPDPKGLVDGLNLYAYARQNPVKYTDTGGTAPGDGEEGGGFFPNVASPKPGLFRTWNYRLSLPRSFTKSFHNVQKHHPQEVQTRIWQTNGEYTRGFSKAQNELTLSLETGKGYIHTALRPYLDKVNAAVRSGVLKSEGDKWQATENAHIRVSNGSVISSSYTFSLLFPQYSV